MATYRVRVKRTRIDYGWIEVEADDADEALESVEEGCRQFGPEGVAWDEAYDERGEPECEVTGDVEEEAM